MSSARHQDQGPGEALPGRGFELVKRLEVRAGLLALLELEGGEAPPAFNIAWGRDVGAEWEHGTPVSPEIAGAEIAFLTTDEVVHAIAPCTTDLHYVRT
jgi:hypothetical protein